MSKWLIFGLATLCMVATHGFTETPPQTQVSSSPENITLLKRREQDRQRYTVEQKTLHNFICEKKIDYAPYFAAYLFGVEVDSLHNTLFIISKSESLVFDQQEIDEIKRRVLFMDDFQDTMDKYYFSHSDLQGSFDPHKFGWPEYKNVPYAPFTSVNSTDTHLYGFVNRPKKVQLIAGMNFLEDGPYGKQTNPQAIFIDYEFGPRRNGSLEERKAILFHKLNEDFKKTKEEVTSSFHADRLPAINEVCRITKKSKDEITILDVGCGLGKVLHMLRMEGYKKLHGIDMDSSKIDVLQKVCAENGIQEISVALINMNSEKVLDAIRQEFKHNVFDVILLHDTIEHIPDPRATLHTINSLLAPGGAILFTGMPDVNSLSAQFEAATYGDYNKFTHCNFFTKEGIAAFAHEEGFKVIFLHDNNSGPNIPNINWSFIYDECFPYVVNETWWVLGRQLPDGMTIRDVFSDNALVYNMYSQRPQDGCQMKVTFERYKLYEKHKEYVNLLCKKFFIETTNTILSEDELKDQLKGLKENLFLTLVLDTPTGIGGDDRELLATIDDAESMRIQATFQDAYQLSLRTRWCYFTKKRVPV